MFTDEFRALRSLLGESLAAASTVNNARPAHASAPTMKAGPFWARKGTQQWWFTSLNRALGLRTRRTRESLAYVVGPLERTVREFTSQPRCQA